MTTVTPKALHIVTDSKLANRKAVRAYVLCLLLAVETARETY